MVAFLHIFGNIGRISFFRLGLDKTSIAWNKVDPKVVLGADYSSGQGYGAINKELQAEGILPKVKGGGGCGV